MIKASAVKFIKLGRGGVWEEYCIKNNVIALGFDNPYHDQCQQENWDFIYQYWFNKSQKNTDTAKKTEATKITNQIRDFYTAPTNVMWITFHNRKLYWCFSEREVEEHHIDAIGYCARIRRVIGNWQSTDVNGSELFVESLSGKLTMVQMYRGTICAVKESEYLLRKINAVESDQIIKVTETFKQLINSIKPLITSLTWKDFELLVDLVFSNAGWQRIATLGGTEKDIDLDLLSPVSGRRAFVQVKSQSSLDEFTDYIKAFEGMNQYSEMYYVCHTDLDIPKDSKQNIQFIGLEKMAELTVNAGLVNWLIAKAS